MGRIICLADCFDAMTSNRTYRKALPLEVALTEIRRCSGTQFDPLLAEAFLRTDPEGLQELLRDHQEKSKHSWSCRKPSAPRSKRLPPLRGRVTRRKGIFAVQSQRAGISQ